MNEVSTISIAKEGLQKGIVRNDKQLVAWDCVQDCDPDRCPIGSKCMYTAKSNPKCALQTEYLQSFVDMIFSTYRYIDEADMFRIGMHLVPLYSQLCRMKIVEKSVGNVTYEDMKGVTRIHPIFREIRDTVKTISSLWREMGFTAVPDPALPSTTFVNGREGFGDPNHYASLIKDSDNKRNVIR